MIYSKTKEYNCTLAHEPLVENIAHYITSGSVLDIGVGSGRDALYLAKRGFIITALDNDQVHLDKLRSVTKELDIDMVLLKEDILTYGPDSQFDVVICDMVLHFFEPIAVLNTVQKVQDMTLPGGLNLVSAYSDKNPPGKRPYLFKPLELKNMYEGWIICSYEEKPTEWFHIAGEEERRRNHAVYLLARKPAYYVATQQPNINLSCKK